MISLLIARPPRCDSEIERLPPKRIVRERLTRNIQTVDDFNRDEETYAFKLVAWLFVLLILPAILALFYLALNPEAFMIDTTPNIDFSTWQ